MENEKVEEALRYHARTRHSPRSVRENVHFLDWDNEPLLFKIYPDRPPIPLPLENGRANMPALSAIAAVSAARRETAPSLEDLATLLYFAAGITKRRRYGGGEILFRAAACTGALYEIELYLVCGPLRGLEAGVYHFDPADQALRRLREGDYRGVLAAATAQEPAVARAPAVIISTGTYWRNAWKYRERTYRHFGWDNGTLLANLLAVAAALDLPARLVCGFVDADVNELLGLDAGREVSLSLVTLGHTEAPAPAPPPVAPLALKTVPYSKREIDYPLIRQMHRASSLSSPEEVAAWRGRAPGDAVAAAPLEEDQLPRDSIEQVILRRGSTRQFARVPITVAELSTMLGRATRGIDADFLAPGGRLNDLYVAVHAVEGLASGAYYYNVEAGRLDALKDGEFRRQAAHLALDQDLAGDASAAVFFLADLNRVLGRFGNRGYRAVQLEAGVLGGKLYLGAYALGLGATGLTFYDDEVTEFFSPHAAGKGAIFLVALGRPARQRR